MKLSARLTAGIARLGFFSLCFVLLLALTACGGAPQNRSGANGGPVLSGAADGAPSMVDDALPSTVEPVASGDYQALLYYLQSAAQSEVYRMTGGEYLLQGRLDSDALFAEELYPVLAACTPRSLDAVDVGTEGAVWFSTLGPTEGGKLAELYLVPVESGTAVSFTVYQDGSVLLPEQRFLLDAGIAEQVAGMLEPYYDAANAKLLERLVQALSAGDAASLETLTGAEAGAYASLEAATLTDVTAEPLPDYAYALEGMEYYRLTLRVQRSADGFLPAGEWELLAELGPLSYDGGWGVLRLTPLASAEQDARLREQPAVQLIDRVNGIGQLGPFASTADIDPALLTDLVLSFARAEYSAGDEDRYDFSVEEVQAAAWKYFGLADFDGTESDCYVDGRYYLAGHDLFQAPTQFTGLETTEDGTMTVTQKVYADPAYLLESAEYIYTLELREDGGCRLVGCRART